MRQRIFDYEGHACFVTFFLLRSLLPAALATKPVASVTRGFENKMDPGSKAPPG